MQGKILRSLGGFYTVESDAREYECRARGNFRHRDQKPLVGDFVEFKAEGEQMGYILCILPRKNALKRPAIANVDRLVIVVSPKDPAPDLLMVDKLLLSARSSGVEPVLLINKCDLYKKESAPLLFEYEKACPTVCTSAHTGEGVGELRALLAEGITCFAGQSAVGKSSLINALCPEAALETGGLSKKTARGKHTTRQTSLLKVGEGTVADTPGFSLVDFSLEPEEVSQYYPEMEPYLGRCAFARCLHLSEPDCAVKESGAVPPGRYERYAQLVKEFREKEEQRYD